VDCKGSMAKLRLPPRYGQRVELPDLPEPPPGMPTGRYPQKVVERPVPVKRPPSAERSRSASGVIEVAK
jgi:hypothetical protein